MQAEDNGNDAFARVLDEIAEADAENRPGAEGSRTRASDETWTLLAARIALLMASGNDPATTRRSRLHHRFLDAPEETEVPELDELPRLPPGLTRVELERLRRLFARVNHPDRCAPADRDVANTRMAAFNRMIDDAITAQLRKAG
ncbi:MAG: hypothetical protein ACOYLQ_13895 [Hyphomicrobiaceae bacterium]